MGLIADTGKYILLMKRVFVAPDRGRMFFRQFPKELEKLGLQSLPIVAIISVFIGFIMTMQTKLNTSNPLLPVYTTGLVTRDKDPTTKRLVEQILNDEQEHAEELKTWLAL